MPINKRRTWKINLYLNWILAGLEQSGKPVFLLNNAVLCKLFELITLARLCIRWWPTVELLDDIVPWPFVVMAGPLQLMPFEHKAPEVAGALNVAVEGRFFLTHNWSSVVWRSAADEACDNVRVESFWDAASVCDPLEVVGEVQERDDAADEELVDDDADNEVTGSEDAIESFRQTISVLDFVSL